MAQDNDGRFPVGSPVEVRYPRSRQEEKGDRLAWPWLPGSIVEQCGPDEWYVCVEASELAALGDGRPAPRGTAPGICITRAVSGIARRSGRAPHRARRRALGRRGERGPADPGGGRRRGVRCGGVRGGGQLHPHL